MGLNFGQSLSEEVFENPVYNLQFHELFSKFSVFHKVKENFVKSQRSKKTKKNFDSNMRTLYLDTEYNASVK